MDAAERGGTNWSSQTWTPAWFRFFQAYVGVSKVQGKRPSKRTATSDIRFFGEVGALALLTHYVSSSNAEHTEGGAE
jgi:hypothetical protein